MKLSDKLVARMEVETTMARYTGEDRQKEFDIRIVEVAIQLGVDPLKAVRSPAFNLPGYVVAEIKAEIDQLWPVE